MRLVVGRELRDLVQKGFEGHLCPDGQGGLVEAHFLSLYKGGHIMSKIAELFKIARSTVYRIIQRTP